MENDKVVLDDHMSNETIASRLAFFAANLKYDDLPREVVIQAKRCLLDTIGVGLAGFGTTIGETFISLAKEWSGVEEATIFGDGVRVPSTNAALVNGTMSHIHELDDGHRFALGHPGTTSIPPAIAMAEKTSADGKDLITATVLGYDVFVRIATAMNPSHRARGFHTTGTCGTFGAAAAAGKVLGLDSREMVNVFGIAGVQAAGLMEVFRGNSMIKPLNAGRAAYNGTLSALLAARGITAPDTIIEGDNGFLNAYSDQTDQSKILNGLNENFHIMGIYVKLHAACRHAHPAIDCVLQLKREYALSPEQVDRILVKTYSAAYKLTGTEYEPKTESTAKFSIPYCLAVALTYNKVGPSEFTIDKIRDANLIRFGKRVEVRIDPGLDKLAPNKRGASVELFTKDGQKYEWSVENPKGEPETPVSDTELRSKFKILVDPILGENKSNKIIDVLTELENVNDLRNVTRLLYR